jgi:predicted N-acetyltransferase YhbS
MGARLGVWAHFIKAIIVVHSRRHRLKPAPVTQIVPLNQIPAAAIEGLLDAAFGADRHGRTAYKLRAGTEAIASLSFATVADGALVGSLQSWPVVLETLSGTRTPLVLIGPVAVDPAYQRSGIGRMLMAHMLEVADAGAVDALMMIGDPEYYGRFFGFTAEATAGWHLPGPVERHRLLARIRRVGGVPTHGSLKPNLSLTL